MYRSGRLEGHRSRRLEGGTFDDRKGDGQHSWQEPSTFMMQFSKLRVHAMTDSDVQQSKKTHV